MTLGKQILGVVLILTLGPHWFTVLCVGVPLLLLGWWLIPRIPIDYGTGTDDDSKLTQ